MKFLFIDVLKSFEKFFTIELTNYIIKWYNWPIKPWRSLRSLSNIFF